MLMSRPDKLTPAMTRLLRSYAEEFSDHFADTQRADAILAIKGRSLDGHADANEYKTAKRLAEIGALTNLERHEFGLCVTVTELGAGLIYDHASDAAT